MPSLRAFVCVVPFEPEPLARAEATLHGVTQHGDTRWQARRLDDTTARRSIRWAPAPRLAPTAATQRPRSARRPQTKGTSEFCSVNTVVVASCCRVVVPAVSRDSERCRQQYRPSSGPEAVPRVTETNQENFVPSLRAFVCVVPFEPEPSARAEVTLHGITQHGDTRCARHDVSTTRRHDVPSAGRTVRLPTPTAATQRPRSARRPQREGTSEFCSVNTVVASCRRVVVPAVSRDSERCRQQHRPSSGPEAAPRGHRKPIQ